MSTSTRAASMGPFMSVLTSALEARLHTWCSSVREDNASIHPFFELDPPTHVLMDRLLGIDSAVSPRRRHQHWLQRAQKLFGEVTQTLTPEQAPDPVRQLLKHDWEQRDPDHFLIRGIREYLGIAVEGILEPVWAVYGDWLLERKDEIRGRLIQIHGALQSDANGNEEKLRGEKRELERRLERALRGELGLEEDHVKGCKWERGYLKVVELINPRMESLEALFMSEHARFLRKLTLGVLEQDLFRILARSSKNERLTSLDLHDNLIGAAGARVLADSVHLSSLSKLDLGGNNVGDEGARAIAASKSLRSLSFLVLVNNNISDDGIRALRESPHLRGIKIIL